VSSGVQVLQWHLQSRSIFSILLFFSAPAHAQQVKAPSVARASAEATLSSSIAGTVEALPFKEGAAFRAGDVLVLLDCALLEAEVAVTRAEQMAAQSRRKAIEMLFARGGTGRAEVEAAEASSKAAEAKAEIAAVRVKGCTISAPFDGRVLEYAVNPHEHVEPAAPVMLIVSSGKPELEIIAPDTWLRWVAPGMTGQVQFEAALGTHDVVLAGIAPVVDPVSRTVKLSARFESKADGVLPGMSGLVIFESRGRE